MDSKFLEEANFQVAFEWLQKEAAEIQAKSFGFDHLIDDFEEWFDGVTACYYLGAQVKATFEPLFTHFRNARVGLKIGLIHGELSEMLEAVRKNKGPDDHIHDFSAEEAEAADVVIRLMNYATDRKLRLAEAIIAKNNYNRTRQDHTKEARESKHGKRF